MSSLPLLIQSSAPFERPFRLYLSAAHHESSQWYRPDLAAGLELNLCLFFRLLSGFAWEEPLLAAVVPDPATGLSVLQVLRLSGAQDGGDDCLCSVHLEEDSRQSAGKPYWFHVRLKTTHRHPRCIDRTLLPRIFVFQDKSERL